MIARSAVAVAMAIAGSWAVAGPAAALEPGVFVDPGSPAGKEYTVPLSVLRAAGSGRSAIEGQAQPLFGIGITPARASGVVATSPGHRHGPERVTRAQGVHGNGGSAGRTRAAAATRPASGAGSAPARGPALAGIGTRPGSSAPDVALFTGLIVLGGLALGALLVVARRRLD
jgi:hypothetical protein